MGERRTEEMSRLELVRELEKLEIADRRYAASADAPDRERLIHDLHVHQIELEMQNVELRQAQERLEEARERYADLYDFAPVGYATLDRAGIIRDINLTGAALLGAPRGDLIGRSLSTFVSHAGRRALRDHLEACHGAERRVTAEVTLPRGGHGTRTVQLISEPVASVSGSNRALAARTILVDISAVKQLEDQLRLLSRAGETLGASLDLAATLDAAARIAVPALADLCMIDVVEEGASERAAVVLAEPGQAALADRLRRPPLPPGWQALQVRVIASGEPVLLEDVPDQAAGELGSDADPAHAGICSLMVVPLVARHRTLGAVTLAAIESGRRYGPSDLGLARDLANRIALAIDNARLYAEARRAITSRDATLAVVSHDLRVPLNAITMSTSLVMDMASQREPDARIDRSLLSIQRAARRMNRLIQDLLDVSSIEAGTFSVVPHREPVGPLVDGAMEAILPQAALRSQRIAVDFPAGDQLAVEADRDRLLQVLDNLIGNAIKFSRPGSAITVRVEPRGDELWFSVADTGPGIAPDDLAHVFDRFWKVQRTAHLGTGLGLAIAKGIVEAHRGRIWAESEPGVGSRFWFALPLAAAVREPPAARDPDSAPGARKVALIVDDDPDARDVLAAVLSHGGYDILEAADGAQALARLHHAPPPALIVLDLAMPVMSGWGFLAERAKDPALRVIPVLVVTGERGQGDRLAALDAVYLQKPASAELLLEAAARLVG